MLNDICINDGIEIYFEYVNECIKTYNKLITISCLSNPLELKRCYFNIIQILNKIIPWSYNYEINKLFLAKNDGILCYKKLFTNLEDNLTKVLETNYSLIDNIRNIRNGLEHAPHHIEIYEMSSGCNSSFIEFIRIKDNESKKYIVKSTELLKLLKSLTKIYEDILKKILANIDTYFSNSDSYTLKYLISFKFEEIG